MIIEAFRYMHVVFFAGPLGLRLQTHEYVDMEFVQKALMIL